MPKCCDLKAIELHLLSLPHCDPAFSLYAIHMNRPSVHCIVLPRGLVLLVSPCQRSRGAICGLLAVLGCYGAFGICTKHPYPARASRPFCLGWHSSRHPPFLPLSNDGAPHQFSGRTHCAKVRYHRPLIFTSVVRSLFVLVSSRLYFCSLCCFPSKGCLLLA